MLGGRRIDHEGILRRLYSHQSGSDRTVVARQVGRPIDPVVGLEIEQGVGPLRRTIAAAVVLIQDLDVMTMLPV